MPKLYQKRGTRAQLDAAKAANQLNAGEIYVITDENRLAVGLSANTYQDFDKEPFVTTWANKPAGNTLTPYVDRIFVTDAPNNGEWFWDGSAYVKDSTIITDYGSITGAANAPTTGYNGFASNLQVVASWANMPPIASVTPYIDRVFCIGVGVGGSEWYSDGTRWRAVGGEVVLKKVLTGGTSTSPAISVLESVLLHGNLAKTGDIITLDCLVHKTSSSLDAGSLGFLGGATGTNADTNINQSSIGLAANAGSVQYMTAFKIKSASEIEFVSIPVGYVGAAATSGQLLATYTKSFNSTVDRYISLFHNFTATATSTASAINLKVTLQTCG